MGGSIAGVEDQRAGESELLRGRQRDEIAQDGEIAPGSEIVRDGEINGDG